MRITEHLPSRTACKLGISLTKVVNLYAQGGFVVKVILMNQEFNKVAEHLPLVESNTTLPVNMWVR